MAVNLTFSLGRPINLLNIPEKKDEYHDTMVQEMKKARALGMRICLFMCRTENQALPEEKGKLWLSADKELGGPIPTGRIHLWIDLTNKKELEKFYGLVDEIAVDQSSVKFLAITNFIDDFVKLFYPSSTAKFVFENDFCESLPKGLDQPITSAYQIRWPENHRLALSQKRSEWFARTYTKGTDSYQQKFNQFSEKIAFIASRQKWDEAKFHKQFESWTIQNEFPPEEDPGYSVKREANEKRKILLEEYFQSVKLVENQPYPYETSYRSQNDCYFIAEGLKNKSATNN